MENVPNVIKTGNDPIKTIEIDPEIMKTTEGLMITLIEKAIGSAAKYAKSANRDNVSSTDMIYALQYEAHEFMKHEDLEERIKDNLSISEDEDEDEDEEIDQSDTAEVFTRAPDTDPICKQMNEYHDNWNSWVPKERTEIILKNAVDKVLLNYS